MKFLVCYYDYKERNAPVFSREFDNFTEAIQFYVYSCGKFTDVVLADQHENKVIRQFHSGLHGSAIH